MSSAKRFMLTLASISFIVWIGGSILMGPAGLSKDYLENFGDHHDEYLEIIKSNEYKLYRQRPHLHEPGQPHVPEDFAQQLDFVETYTAQPEYQSELRRMHLYEVFFNVFNSLLLIAIIWRFARKPLLQFLDSGLARLQTRMESASEERRKSELRLLEAKEKLGHVDEERAKVLAETEERLNRELEALQEMNEQSLTMLDLEFTDRKQHEYHTAAMQVKSDIVNEAISQLENKYRNNLNEANQAVLLQRFIVDLGRFKP